MCFLALAAKIFISLCRSPGELKSLIMPNNSTLYTLFTLSAPRKNIDLMLPAVGSEMPYPFCMQKSIPICRVRVWILSLIEAKQRAAWYSLPLGPRAAGCCTPETISLPFCRRCSILPQRLQQQQIRTSDLSCKQHFLSLASARALEVTKLLPSSSDSQLGTTHFSPGADISMHYQHLCFLEEEAGDKDLDLPQATLQSC